MKLFRLFLITCFYITSNTSFATTVSWSQAKSLFMQKRRVTLKPLGGYPSLLKKEDGKITFVIHFKTKKVAQLFFKSDRTFADSSFIDDLERLVSLVKKRNSKFCNQIEMKEWGKGFEETSDQTPITVTFVYNIISSNKYKFECSIAITKPDLDLISFTEMNDC